MWRLLNLRALGFAAAITLLLVVAIVIGSRNLQNFDAALVAYLFRYDFCLFRHRLSVRGLATTTANLALLPSDSFLSATRDDWSHAHGLGMRAGICRDDTVDIRLDSIRSEERNN